MVSDDLKIGKASDLSTKKDRILYRSLEMMPGALAWGALFLVAFLSWKKPAWIAILVIFFALYWLFRSIYLSFHLMAGYKKMKEHEEADWLKRLKQLKVENSKLKIHWEDIYHLIIFPMYREPLQVIRESFLALSRTDYPKDKMMVILGCEESSRQHAKDVVKEIEREFASTFFKLFITWHPAALPGEIAGHGSNETWAAKKAKEQIIDPLRIPYQRIIVSSFDADTQVFPKYFSCLTWHYLTSKEPTRTSFQPIPLYINNIWQAPLFSQIFSFASTFWHTMNQERPDKLISFSSHSLPFQALVEAGFKQTNVVSDDSRIFWQCFFQYGGQYRAQPLYYPLSMDANVAKNIFKTALNIYRQQRRWAYGVGEIPYFVFNFLKNKKIKLSKKISLGFEVIEGHFSWAVAPILIFVLGWLPLVLGGAEFSQTIISYNLPKTTSFILTFSMLGLVFSVYFGILLLPPKPLGLGKWRYLAFSFGWLLVPLMMIFFSALPALDAQTRWLLGKYMGFWPTEKMR